MVACYTCTYRLEMQILISFNTSYRWKRQPFYKILSKPGGQRGHQYLLSCKANTSSNHASIGSYNRRGSSKTRESLASFTAEENRANGKKQNWETGHERLESISQKADAQQLLHKHRRSRYISQDIARYRSVDARHPSTFSIIQNKNRVVLHVTCKTGAQTMMLSLITLLACGFRPATTQEEALLPLV